MATLTFEEKLIFTPSRRPLYAHAEVSSRAKSACCIVPRLRGLRALHSPRREKFFEIFWVPRGGGGLYVRACQLAWCRGNSTGIIEGTGFTVLGDLFWRLFVGEEGGFRENC